jgi:colanic acid/amylovoran biosynthesis glycosyltransferase
MLTFIHNNPIELRDGVIRVDRKFHEGMLNYVRHIPVAITTVHPWLRPEQLVMDSIELSVNELPYRVTGVHVPDGIRLASEDQPTLEALIGASSLVVGFGYGAAVMAKRLGKPYVPILEYDLQTQLIVTRSHARSWLGGWKNMAMTYWHYRREMLPALQGAREVHCNGYPIFEAVADHNEHRLLYLDSRLTREMVISLESLRERLAQRGTRPLRLMYSGRYEPMKGALDAVQAAAELIRRGVDVEMDTYGQGSQAAAMQAVASKSAGRIRVHSVIPFPVLMKTSYGADIFIACHIQSDPSCTYLESLGAGIPIVGYRNRMWRGMARVSSAGVVVERDTPQAVADAVQTLLATPGELEACSERARAFARAHVFETEFLRRTDAINALLGVEDAAAQAAA